MEILNVPRGFGKTTNILIKAITTGYPVVVANRVFREDAKRRLGQITRKNIEIYTIKEFCNDDFWRGRKRPEKVLIDDLNVILREILNADCEMATMTSGSLEDYDIKKYEKRLKK